jgi:hypothetical protein
VGKKNLKVAIQNPQYLACFFEDRPQTLKVVHKFNTRLFRDPPSLDPAQTPETTRRRTNQYSRGSPAFTWGRFPTCLSVGHVSNLPSDSSPRSPRADLERGLESGAPRSSFVARTRSYFRTLMQPGDVRNAVRFIYYVYFLENCQVQNRMTAEIDASMNWGPP